MKFAICAGHGGRDPGVVIDGIKESDVAVELRDMVATELRALGHTVVTDRSPLIRNLELAKSMMLIPGTDCAIEIHCNGSNNPTATGVEVLALPKHKARAQALAGAVAAVLSLPLRGDKGFQPQTVSPHGSLGFVRVGGMILETFFLSNPKDYQQYWRNQVYVAEAIANTLADFKG